MNERFTKAFGPLTIRAGWDGEDLPPISEVADAGFLRISHSATNRIIHERTDILARRIGWLLSYAEKYPEKVQQWNCFCNVRLAAGKTQKMIFELLSAERGAKTDDIVSLARELNEPLVFDWIDSRRTIKTRGPVHTGIILGFDSVKDDALIFEKDGKDPPLVRYWKEVEDGQKSKTEYVTWSYLENVMPDPDEKNPDTREDMDWI